MTTARTQTNGHPRKNPKPLVNFRPMNPVYSMICMATKSPTGKRLANKTRELEDAVAEKYRTRFPKRYAEYLALRKARAAT